MQGQMGSQGPRANPFMTSDQNSSRPGNSMQGPSGHNVGHDAFMTSRQNAQPQGGPVHRPTSSSYPASGRVAQPQELPVMDPRLTAPREPIIPVWYPAENNWNMCIQQMAETFRRVQCGASNYAPSEGEWQLPDVRPGCAKGTHNYGSKKPEL
ncbi:unnamed protein product [Polarella glacialis]|uniref:Uncharacterized protein n=1 Tax=Polarella glacialis TaxID=89957 RepID=A0A813IGN3_POLGL|nr:unnamed protein product [Polarella glacialis]